MTEDELFWIDTKGKVVRHEKADLRVTSKASYPWLGQVEEFVTDFTIPSPLVIAGNFACEPRKNWRGLIVNLVLAALLALFCYRRQRQFGAQWTWAWVAFVLMFGLLGFVGYLACRTWPARLPCPHCGRRSPRDHASCCLCGAAFPPPAKKGIEVFAQ